MNKIDIRKLEFQEWLDKFCEMYDLGFPGQTLTYDKVNIEYINKTYWSIVNIVKTVKSDSNSNLNVHKIIAGVQLSILYHQPLELNIFVKNIAHIKGEARINAEFSYFVAINILDNFEPENSFLTNKLLLDANFKKRQEENILWLENFNFDDNLNNPNLGIYFLLSQFWALIDDYRKKL